MKGAGVTAAAPVAGATPRAPAETAGRADELAVEDAGVAACAAAAPAFSISRRPERVADGGRRGQLRTQMTSRTAARQRKARKRAARGAYTRPPAMLVGGERENEKEREQISDPAPAYRATILTTKVFGLVR